MFVADQIRGNGWPEIAIKKQNEKNRNERKHEIKKVIKL